MTFKAIASKIQDELAEIIANGDEVNEYGLIVYIPLHNRIEYSCS